MKIVAIKDRALNAFMNPFYVPSIGIALRSFGDEVNRPDNEMGKHPTDYELYHLGEFHDDNARFELLEEPARIQRAEDIKQ